MKTIPINPFFLVLFYFALLFAKCEGLDFSVRQTPNESPWNVIVSIKNERPRDIFVVRHRSIIDKPVRQDYVTAFDVTEPEDPIELRFNKLLAKKAHPTGNNSLILISTGSTFEFSVDLSFYLKFEKGRLYSIGFSGSLQTFEKHQISSVRRSFTREFLRRIDKDSKEAEFSFNYLFSSQKLDSIDRTIPRSNRRTSIDPKCESYGSGNLIQETQDALQNGYKTVGEILKYAERGFDKCKMKGDFNSFTRFFGKFKQSHFIANFAGFYRMHASWEKIYVECGDSECDDLTYAMVDPMSHFTIYICNLYFLAPSTIQYNSKPGTLIHEMSHFMMIMGTTDNDNTYGQTECEQLARSDTSKALMNADNWEYFSEFTRNPIC